jgi:hypothetical protein
MATPSSHATGTSTTTGASPRSPAANALAITIAARGVGVTMTLVRMPASRSQMIWIPKKIATKSADWARIPGVRNSR